jgi:hypothetical protein
MAANFQRRFLILFFAIAACGGCQQVQNFTKPAAVVPATLRDVPAQRLGYRFEPDVLAPPEAEKTAPAPEKLPTIQADFDSRRPQDALERTIAAPDKQRVLAIYQSIGEERGDYRLDLYDTNGKLLRKITPANLALRFPDSIVWSPDGANFVFAGARRFAATANQEIVQEAPRPDIDAPPTVDANAVPSPSPVASSANALTFRTEQVYLSNRDGGELKPLTQNEGLIYFYFVWSPDSQMLAALAAKENEWSALLDRANQQGEVFKPYGRPRLLEKNGRERRLDDGLTQVFPVWSPDSSKIAVGYDKQVRIYDALGNQPTSAAIPLQVPLLLASKQCDDKIAAGQSCVNAAATDANVNTATSLPTTEPTTFLPVARLFWAEDKTLYLQTGKFVDFVRGDPVRSFPRWHRLNFSPQAATIK